MTNPNFSIRTTTMRVHVALIIEPMFSVDNPEGWRVPSTAAACAIFSANGGSRRAAEKMLGLVRDGGDSISSTEEIMSASWVWIGEDAAPVLSVVTRLRGSPKVQSYIGVLS